jgi:hypothetical protein
MLILRGIWSFLLLDLWEFLTIGTSVYDQLLPDKVLGTGNIMDSPQTVELFSYLDGSRGAGGWFSYLFPLYPFFIIRAANEVHTSQLTVS